MSEAYIAQHADGQADLLPTAGLSEITDSGAGAGGGECGQSLCCDDGPASCSRTRAGSEGGPDLAPQPGAAPPMGGAGSPKQVLACLAALPMEHVVFETDSPSQGFWLHPRYARWCDAVFGACGPAVRAPRPAGSAGGRPENEPAHVRHVIRAAAIWRCLHSATGTVPPPQQSRRPGQLALGEAHGSGGGESGGGGGGGGTAWPSRAALCACYEELVRASTANVDRVFSSSP
jgi:hypothetical protein